MSDKFMNWLGLPTIQQIIAKGDNLCEVPMDKEEAQEFFDATVAENRAKASSTARDGSVASSQHGG